VNDRNIHGVSPLWCAAGQGWTAIIQLLLSYGAEPNLRGGVEKKTPLIMAAAQGFYDIFSIRKMLR